MTAPASILSPDIFGYMASALVLATFCMRTMLPLRIVAICSNIAFFAYGWSLDLMPVALLHAVLLPVNVCRLWQILGAEASFSMFKIGSRAGAADGTGQKANDAANTAVPEEARRAGF